MHRYPAILTNRRELSPTAIELTFQRPDKSAFPYFLAGQYATISFPKYPLLRGERSFSIASSPTEPTALSFGIRIGGRYTQGLRTLKPGDAAKVALPFGSFTFDPSTDKRALFIAGGIGITPFLSMIRTATTERLPNELTLLYSVRDINDVPYRPELDALSKANPNFRYAIAVSSGKIPDSPIFTSGRITPQLIAGAIDGHVADQSYFLCGPPAFMAAMLNELKLNGVAPQLVHTERFSAGSSDLIERKTFVPWFTIASWGLATAAIISVIFKAEQTKRNQAIIIPWVQTTIPTTPAATDTTITPTPTPIVTPTNTAATPTPTPVKPTPTPTPTPIKRTPAPVVTQPAPQPVYQAPVQPQTRLS